MRACGERAGFALTLDRPIGAGTGSTGVSGVVETLGVPVGSLFVHAVRRGSRTLGAAVSGQHIRVGAGQRWTPPHETLDVPVYAAARPACVGGMREFLSVGIFLPRVAAAVAVVLTARSG